jgi:hypothetical protein
MTKGQWLLYLYDIYPAINLLAGFAISVFIISLAVKVALLLDPHTETEAKELVDKIVIVSSIIIIILSFMPSKNTLITMLTTPSIVEYIGKNDNTVNNLE